MCDLAFEVCWAGPYLLIQAAMQPNDGGNVAKYYLFFFCFGDDVLCMHHDSDNILQRLYIHFSLKRGYGNPHMYLGAKLTPVRMDNGVLA